MKNTVACQFLNNPTNNLVTAFYIFTNGHKGANLRCSQTFPLIQGKVFARRIIATIPAIGYTNFTGTFRSFRMTRIYYGRNCYSVF